MVLGLCDGQGALFTADCILVEQGWKPWPRAILIFIPSSQAIQNDQLKNNPAIFDKTFN